MIDLLLIASGSFMIAMSGALMPGPLLTITIGESAKRGAKTGPLLIVGHSILEGILVILILLGFSKFLEMKGFKIFSFLSGGVILAVMGYMMVRGSSKVTLEGGSGPSKKGNTIILGILGSLSNPYWIIWWATIGLGYLVASIKFGTAGVVAFFIGHISADFAWYTLVSVAISKGKSVFSTNIYRRLILFCGIFLIAFGAWFLVECTKLLMS